MKRHVMLLAIMMSVILFVRDAQTQEGTGEPVPRFEGFLHKGLQSADNRKVPLFIDVSISEFTPVDSQKVPVDDFLKSIASETKELNQLFSASRLVLEFDTPTITDHGKPVNGFLLVAVYPRKGITGKEEFQNSVAFTPGPLTHLKEVFSKYGECTAKQTWSADGTRLIGLDGTVYWWGEVGVSASHDDSITHVFIRASIKKK